MRHQIIPYTNIQTMATYDSDSSDGEEGDFTKTTTLLGYASEEPTDDPISQLGGYPVCHIFHIFYICTDFLPRHGWTTLLPLQAHSESVKSATIISLFSSNSTAIIYRSFPATKDGYTSSAADAIHAEEKKEAYEGFEATELPSIKHNPQLNLQILLQLLPHNRPISVPSYLADQAPTPQQQIRSQPQEQN
jgi:hypothetical protein